MIKNHRVTACFHCGQDFEPHPLAHRAKFCLPCRPIVKAIRIKAYKQTHPESGKDRAREYARTPRGKELRSAANKRRYAANPDKFRIRSMKHHQQNREQSIYGIRRSRLARYGITPEIYDDLLVKQDGVCAICRKTCSSGMRLAVDHEHGSGKVRGLLCGQCNTGLGKFRDSVEVLTRASEYIQRHAAKPALFLVKENARGRRRA